VGFSAASEARKGKVTAWLSSVVEVAELGVPLYRKETPPWGRSCWETCRPLFDAGPVYDEEHLAAVEAVDEARVGRAARGEDDL